MTGAIPSTEGEMVDILVQVGLKRAYVALSIAARERPLTEQDIAEVEIGFFETFKMPSKVAGEFETFQAEAAWAKAIDVLQKCFATAHVERLRAADAGKPRRQ